MLQNSSFQIVSLTGVKSVGGGFENVDKIRHKMFFAYRRITHSGHSDYISIAGCLERVKRVGWVRMSNLNPLDLESFV